MQDVIHFEVSHSFLIKLFLYMTKTSGRKRKCLKNKKSFYHEIKSLFHRFQRVFIAVIKKKNFEGESSTLWKTFNRKLMKFLIERNILNNVTLIVFKLRKYLHVSVYKKKSQQTFTYVKKV